ncbi:hypothetical protein Tco_0259713 [Tanacetum coccineum]
MLIETLKTSLPLLLNDLIKDFVATSIEEKLPLFDTQLQQTLKDQLPKLIIKPMNNEFNAFNKLEANRFVILQTELSKANVEGEKWEKNNPETPKDTESENKNDALVIHASEENVSKEKASDKEATDDEPPMKKLKFLIPTPTPLRSIFPEPTPIDPTPLKDPTPLREPTPPRYERKGKGIATEEEPMKHLLPLIEQGGSDPNMLNLQQFSTFEYEAKRAKMLSEYNHYITYRADKRPITQINYRIDRVSKDATMRIERDNQPLSLVVFEKFGLKQLEFSEWIETQTEKLGLPPPPELIAFGLSAAEKKRKRTSEILKEVFVTEDIIVDGMHRNLIPPLGVVGSRGLVITEPESGIFYYNGNYDLVFQRENELHLATTAQLIRQLSYIQRTSLEAKEIIKKLEFTMKARNDVEQARKIIRDNLDKGGM